MVSHSINICIFQFPKVLSFLYCCFHLLQTEQATKDSTCLRDAVNELSSRAFTNIYRDRTSISESNSKRHGIFIIANTLFKLYFRMNTLQLCNKLIGNVESSKPMMDNLHLFPPIDIATYKYYVGRLKTFEDKFDEAREALRLALQLTPLSEVRNRQRILACLVPIEVINSSLVLTISP